LEPFFVVGSPYRAYFLYVTILFPAMLDGHVKDFILPGP